MVLTIFGGSVDDLGPLLTEEGSGVRSRYEIATAMSNTTVLRVELGVKEKPKV